MDTLHETPNAYKAQHRINAIMALNLSKRLTRTLQVIGSFVPPSTRTCFPKVATIAKRRGLSVRAVQYHITQLQSMGVLVVNGRTYRGRQSSNSYSLPCLEAHAHPFNAGVDVDRPKKLHPSGDDFCTPLKREETVFTGNNKQIPCGDRFSFEKGMQRSILEYFFTVPREYRGSLVNILRSPVKTDPIFRQVCTSLKVQRQLRLSQ